MKIGFACKYVDPRMSKEELEAHNTKGTTVTWLKRQSFTVAERKVQAICFHNVAAVKRVLTKLAHQPDIFKMMRISSDMLPCFTHEDCKQYYQDRDFLIALEKKFHELGEFARTNNIRLSFHPGQFVVLASDRDDVVARSIEEFEYHAMMAKWMGYAKTFQDFKCNVHLSGKRGIDGMRNTWNKLSTEARNILTLENDEVVCGVDTLIEISDIIPVVLDIHHHFIKTNSYIMPTDDLVNRVKDSWRGLRPTMHYSYSRDEFVKDHTSFPCLLERKGAGVSLGKLRAHSEMYPNKKVNSWALSFVKDFDIMCEAKQKNLAAAQLISEMI